VDGADAKPVPLLAIRFAPNLDARNRAPGGRFSFPMYVQRNGSAQPGPVGKPVVEASFDDGKTWVPVRVTRQHGRCTVTVDHPAGARFVSLRASVSERDGNAVEQTILRAYAIR
jgi:hypothetical protein